MAPVELVSLAEEKVGFIDAIYRKADRWQNYDKALAGLKKVLPNNDDLQSVLVKASAIVEFYGLWIFDVYPPSKRLTEYYRKNRKVVINYEHVDDIAKVEFGDEEKSNIKNLKSFASKYLHFFDENGERIAIYDNFSSRALALHLGYGRTRYQERNYEDFFKHRFSNLFNRHRNITSSCPAHYLNLSERGAPSRPGRTRGSLFQAAFLRMGLWALPG